MARLTPQQMAKKLATQRKQLDSLLVKSMNDTLPKLKKLIQTRHLSGPTSANSVSKRSGKLRGSIVITKASPGVSEGVKSAEGTLTIKAPYAGVHIGKKPGKTVIKAKAGKKLAIPTSFAQRKSGSKIAGPRSARWGSTFIRNNTIYGRTGSTARSIKPLFTLRDRVVIPVRIDIESDIVQEGQKIFLEDTRVRLGKVLGI